MIFEIDIPELLGNLSGIYKIENDIDDRVYIGRAKNLRKRAEGHKRRYKYKECNRKVNKFLEEHPEASFRFTVIEFTDSIKEEEERYIEEYGSVERGFNILHNDEEFLQRKWEHSDKRIGKRAERHIMGNPESQDMETLTKGYIRFEEKLYYSPRKAKRILDILKQLKREEEVEEPKRKPHRRDKDWKPMNISFLYRASKK